MIAWACGYLVGACAAWSILSLIDPAYGGLGGIGLFSLWVFTAIETCILLVLVLIPDFARKIYWPDSRLATILVIAWSTATFIPITVLAADPLLSHGFRVEQLRGLVFVVAYFGWAVLMSGRASRRWAM